MPHPTPPPIVEAIALSKSYPAPGGGRIEVFDDLNLRLEAGKLIAIEGHSGCGKSTLLHVLGLLDPQTSGQVLYDGQPVSDLTEKGRADFRNRHLGFVFQFHHLLREFSALENVMMPLWIGGMPRAEAERQAEESLVRVGLADRIQHRPGELSGGEQQRVAVARALVNRPRLLLADEPTGNLDESTAEGIHDLFLKLNEESGTSAVVVTHNRAFAARFSQRFRLHLGNLIQSQPEAEERSAAI